MESRKEIAPEKFFIDAVDGRETIAQAGRNGTFCFVGKKLKSRRADQFGPATDETEVDFLKVNEGGTFSKKFLSILADPDVAVFIQAQVANFCKKYSWRFKRNQAVMFIIQQRRKLYVLVVARAEDKGIYQGLGITRYGLNNYFSGRMENHSIVVPKDILT